MDQIIHNIRIIIDAGRRYAKQGLLYEAAYKYGQAAALISMLYALHTSGELKLDPAIQSFLAIWHQKLEMQVQSLSHSAGNGHYTKMGAKAHSPKESLHNVIHMLLEDVQGTQWI